MSTSKLTADAREALRQTIWEELQWLLSRTNEATIEWFCREAPKQKEEEEDKG